MIPVRGALGLALVAEIFLAGCASLPPPREVGYPVSRQRREELVARLQMHGAKIRSLRGIAAVEVTLNAQTRRFREAVALRSDGRFRLETLGAFGLPVLIIAFDGSRVVVHDASNQAGLSSDGCELLNRLLGFDLPPAVLAHLLAGLPPWPVIASAFVSYLPSRGTYLLEEEYNNSVQRLYLDPSGILRGGEIWKGRKGLRFDFSAVREVQGISVPMGITLTQVSRPVSITVTYQTIEVNPILADRLFSFPLSPPAENGGC